jgi:hypothetical protein
VATEPPVSTAATATSGSRNGQECNEAMNDESSAEDEIDAGEGCSHLESGAMRKRKRETSPRT